MQLGAGDWGCQSGATTNASPLFGSTSADTIQTNPSIAFSKCLLSHACMHVHPCAMQAIQAYFDTRNPGLFAKLDDLYPVVTTKANFDEV